MVNCKLQVSNRQHMIQSCLNFMSCWSLHGQLTTYNTSNVRWQTAKINYKAVSIYAIDQILSAGAQFMQIDIRWLANRVWALQRTIDTFWSSNSYISEYFTEQKTTFNWASTISRYSGWLISVYSNDNRKLPSPWKIVTIVSRCLGNVIAIATTS